MEYKPSNDPNQTAKDYVEEYRRWKGVDTELRAKMEALRPGHDAYKAAEEDVVRHVSYHSMITCPSRMLEILDAVVNKTI